ncbi:MAG: response regulator transcription factor [Proteobacteria bacterium]|nr:response regulator transcription factor [Pseudomonadota bacterium]
MSTPLAHIVDDDEAIRDALTWLFRTREVASAEWSSAEEFLAAWQPEWRGCIVLDIRMREMSGLECFDVLQEQGNTLPVIFLTGHGDVPMAVSALKKGAFDFLEKPFEDNALVDVVIRALAKDAKRQASQASQASVANHLALLTPREQEVMNLVLAGKFNKVIADELSISMRTVEVHRARVFEKMGVRSAVELAQLLAPSRDKGSGSDSGEH